ncbi:Asp23/Gls24 family envelope stress response protein [Bombilactobacillus folatiphilus]|uniref:Stress response regulator gls24 homolog n=1 Tax=Bombilactobacillus folatiphilus TaxID=2923362 RepID=A0ABY4P8T0_9LACO|nr:Asp23/Gls24 family envelope stress response protein [Bombilactobacillus folatiphilus]UQS82073.1 Asp23/Gls24 family envelope stress response protein [Bombilactobacillus folatiphilus]
MTQVNNNEQIKGELTYDSKVIQKIIGLALSDIDGLLTIDGGFFSNLTDKLVNNDDVTSGIHVEVGKKQVAVDIDIVAEYGIDISKLYDQIKKQIFDKVKKMTDLDVVEVNVSVVDIKTQQEHQKDSVSLQDRISSASKDTKNKVEQRQKANNQAKATEQRVH